ncbi:MAG: hypothetical protein ACJ8DJ_21320 [Gemmatimonadales bacterium]
MGAGSTEQPEGGSAPDEEEPAFVEPRWPIVTVLLSYIALTVVLRIAVPNRASLSPHWLLPVAEIGLLGAVIAANPGDVVGRARWLRPLVVGLIIALAVFALGATVLLVRDLARGSEVTESASALLASGGLVWIGNALIFGLFYWAMDSGGPLARFRRERPFPDFAFSQHLNPELAPPGWRPSYVDYLILGFTTSTAFSPTDVMPMAPWAKLTMAVQSLMSLAVLGLVIARAVNAFT